MFPRIHVVVFGHWGWQFFLVFTFRKLSTSQNDTCNSHAQISELIFMLNGSYCLIFYFLLLDCPELKITATDIEKLLIAYTGWQYPSGNFCCRENTIKGRRCWSCLVRMPWALCCLLPSKYEIHVHVTLVVSNKRFFQPHCCCVAVPILCHMQSCFVYFCTTCTMYRCICLGVYVCMFYSLLIICPVNL